MSMPAIITRTSVGTALTAGGTLGGFCLRVCLATCPQDPIGGIEVACAFSCLRHCSTFSNGPVLTRW